MGSTVVAPKPSARLASTRGRPSARQISVRTPRRQSNRNAQRTQRASFSAEAACAKRRASSGEVLLVCGSLKGGFIKTRVAAPACRPALVNVLGGAPTSSATARTRAPSALIWMFSSASCASSASISTRITSSLGTRDASANPAAPTPDPRSTANSSGRASVAAASRMASWPTRCPRSGWRKISRPPSTASSVVARSGTIRRKLVGEASVFEQTSRRLELFLSDQDATRQDPEGPLEHAHVLIEDEMRDVGALQERLDGREENLIVGANEFTHTRLPDPTGC